MQTFKIGSTAIELPDFLEARVEEDGTLAAYPPRTDFANLRFTVISVANDNENAASAGERIVRKNATEAKAELNEDGARVWYHYFEPASEGSKGSLMRYWEVGMGPHLLVVSCFDDAAQSGHPLTKKVLESVEPAIRSFRGDPE